MINIAKTKDKKIVTAANAEKGEVYYCIVCGCKMHLVIAANGLRYFRCFPGSVHKDPNCHKINNNPLAYSLSLTTPEFLLESIMTPPKKRPTGGSGGGKPGKPRQRKEKEAAIPSLRIFHDNGYDMLEDFEISEGRMLHTLICNELNGHVFMQDNVSMGPLAVVAVPDFVLDWSMTIRFRVPGYLPDKGRCQKIFDLRYSDREVFEKRVAELFDVRCIGNKTYYYSKYLKVLIFGDWQAVEYPDCKSVCKKCSHYFDEYCSGYQMSQVINDLGQLWLPPKWKKSKT